MQLMEILELVTLVESTAPLKDGHLKQNPKNDAHINLFLTSFFLLVMGISVKTLSTFGSSQINFVMEIVE